MITWELSQAIPPHHLRLIVFSLSVLAAKESDERVQATIALLDREIRAAQLHPAAGESQSRRP